MSEATLSEGQLTWLRFRRHRLAMLGLTVVVLLYLLAIMAEFVAPFSPDKSNARLVFHPPQHVHIIDQARMAGTCTPMSTAGVWRAIR